MLRSLLLFAVSSVVVSTASAQVLNGSASGFGASATVQNAASSLPLFLRAGQETQSREFNRQLRKALAHEKECPMPVYRPDTSRRDQSLTVRVSAMRDQGMVAEISCPNPLDTKVTPGPYARADSAQPERPPPKF